MALQLRTSSDSHSRSALHGLHPVLWASYCRYYDLCWLLTPVRHRHPFRRKVRSPQVRTHSFTAQPPEIHHLTLNTRASWFLAQLPCLAVPHIRFLYIGSQFMLRASSPHSVALMQLRFASLVVINLRRDLHPWECAHAGRTRETHDWLVRALVVAAYRSKLKWRVAFMAL